MSEWQPISTAPDDQRSILAAHENSGIQKVCWRIAVGDDRYEYGAGAQRLWRPTHWKPLDPSPRKPNHHPKAGTPLLGS
jgi:hypothetical protein